MVIFRGVIAWAGFYQESVWTSCRGGKDWGGTINMGKVLKLMGRGNNEDKEICRYKVWIFLLRP